MFGDYLCMLHSVTVITFLSLSKKGTFGSAPENIFVQMKKKENQRYVVDSRYLILFRDVDAPDKDYTNIFVEFYPDAVEQIYTKIPDPNMY